jgi:hypothetical protein
MESTITDTLAELITQAPASAVFVDLHLHREPVTVTVELQD